MVCITFQKNQLDGCMEEILEEVQVDINRACGKRPSERGGWLALGGGGGKARGQRRRFVAGGMAGATVGWAEGVDELDRFRVQLGGELPRLAVVEDEGKRKIENYT